jgi:hypothetical protein
MALSVLEPLGEIPLPPDGGFAFESVSVCLFSYNLSLEAEKVLFCWVEW